MRKTIITAVLFCLAIAAVAQRTNQVKKVDSLLKLLAVSKEDTGKVMILLTLADWYETNNQDSAEYYLQKGKILSESLKFDKGIYSYYQQIAILSYTKGEYEKAMKESVTGLAMARKLKDSAKVAAMLNSIGIVHAYLGNLKEQLDYTLQVVKAIESINDSPKISSAYHNLANCYHNISQYRKGVNTAQYSIYINNLSGKKNGYINRVYSTMAQCYEGLRMADSSLYFYDKAISESQKVNDKYAEGMIYGYKCSLLASMYRFSDMLNAAQKSLLLSKELQSRQMMATSLYNIAYAQFHNGNNVEAKKYIYEALAIAQQDSMKDELKNTYMILSYIAAREGDFKTSIFARQKTDSLWAASLNDEVLRSNIELEKKYETEKKDNQIKLQKVEIQKRKTFNYILIGSAAALLLVSLLSYRNYKHKQKLQQQRISELETEKKLTATEAVLKGEEQERTRLAKDLHDGLGGMLSGIKYSMNTMKGNLIMTPDNAQAFERSMDMLDSSIKEMRRVAHNMMPEALVKFGLDTALKDFCTDINNSGALQVSYQSINIDNLKIDQTTAITIYRIVQELINNTMKHAAAKTAIVQVTKSGSQLSVTVEDDGNGFDTEILNRSGGIGWSNIKNRLEFLKGNLDVQSTKEKGTSIHIEVNIQDNNNFN